MQIANSKATAKVAAVATALAMASSMLSFAPAVHAATTCDTGAASLTIGATGMYVTNLQNALIGAGYSIPAGATGYFGTQTQGAVAAWQAASGVAPAAGYFGPISRAAFNLSCDGSTSTGGTSTVAGCMAGDLFSRTTGASCSAGAVVPGCVAGALFSSTTGASCASAGTPDSSGPLAGTDGIINDVDELGSYNGEDVGEGEDDVIVLGAEIEASADGDIALKSVKVSFDSTGNTGSDNLDDYISGVTVWLGDEEIGSADVDDFNENGAVWSKTVSLSGMTTIEADESMNLYISVDAANTFDSADISGDSWTVDVDNIRFVDGAGVYTTDSSTGDIDGMDVPVDFVSFSTAADTELRISKSSDSPDQSIVVIDDTSDTDDVTLLKGKLKLDGTSDAVLDELPVTLTTVGGANVTAVTGSVTLKIDGKSFTETVSISGATAGTVTFDNLDFTIDAGDTVEFEVLADINDIDAGNLDEGDSIKAEVTATNRDYIDIENEQGDQLSDSSEKSGTALGDYQELRTEGVGLTLVSVSKSHEISNNNDAADTGTFKIVFKVTAIGNTMYVSSVAADATNEAVDVGGTATTADSITRTLVNNTDATKTSVGNYQIDEGDTEQFTFTVTVPNGTGGTTGQYRTALTGFLWDTSDDTSPANTYTSSLDEFITEYANLDNA